MTRLLLFCVFVPLAGVFAISVSAQQVSFNYFYKFEPALITEPPQLGGLEVNYPEAAKKNGVEGTVKASAVLGENGTVRDVMVINDLGQGIGEAVAAGLQKLYFKPARFNGKPTAMKLTLDYVISIVYDESDKNVTKPKIVDKPQPTYPASQRAEGVKGKVSVRVLFMASGELQVIGVSSVMPKEFDQAAQEAAKEIKFSPAVHKKSKLPVTQQLTVDYDFKP